MSQRSEHYYVEGDLADLSDVDWERLLGPSESESSLNTTETRATTIPLRSKSTSSTSYFSDSDDLDSAFLAQVDHIEQQALAHLAVADPPMRNNTGAAASGSSANSRNKSNGAQAGAHSTRLNPLKRTLSSDGPEILPLSKRKGKMKVDTAPVELLSHYEDELTCPICCDFFAAAHVTVPCGHTVCGACCWEWHVEKKQKGCPCCRQHLDHTTFMIPNITVDNMVESHMRALAFSGAKEWDTDGTRYQDWKRRKEAWKQGANKRSRQKTRQGKARLFVPGDVIEILDDVWDEEDDNEFRARAIRRARPRRQHGDSGILDTF